MATIDMTPVTLDRESLIAAAGEPAYLASLTTLGRTSTILSNMMHEASEAQDWHTAAAARWLLGRMTVLGLHSQKRSQKAVAAQVERLADAVLERAKLEQAAEIEAAMLASQTAEPLVLYDAAAWLADGSLVALTPAEMAEVAAAFRPFPPEEPEIDHAGRCGYCGRYACICDQEPEPPEPTSPAQAPVPPEPEDEEAIGLALYDAWESKEAAAHYSEEQALDSAFHGIERWLLALEHRSVQRQAAAFWQDYDAALPDILNDWEARCDVLLDLEESDERAAWEHGAMVA